MTLALFYIVGFSGFVGGYLLGINRRKPIKQPVYHNVGMAENADEVSRREVFKLSAFKK